MIDTKAKVLKEKEELDVDIENGYRTLHTLERDLERNVKLLSERKQKLVALANLSEARDKIKDQLLQYRKEKIRQEMVWHQEQQPILKIQLNLLEDERNADKFNEIEKNLEQRKIEITSRNTISKEILIYEAKEKDLDRQISIIQENKFELWIASETLQSQVSLSQTEKKMLIEDLKQKIVTWKELRIELSRILYEEDIRDSVKAAEKKLEILDIFAASN